MATDIPVPDLGEGISEVTITEWLKGVGDEVSEGEPIVAIETDKASMEIDAPVSGTITALLVEVGESLEVGDCMARIDVSAGGDG